MTKDSHTDDLRPRFWENHDLGDLGRNEWEALCDGCGRCCLLKLEDEDTGEVAFTNVACRLFDDRNGRCGQYGLRKQLVAGCVVLTAQNIDRHAYWMPATCAYRLLHAGKPLPEWHPLVTGSQEAMHARGISIRGQVVAEYDIDENDLENHLIEGIL
ncbi:MAG: YcgN family cysteine cluster protein [Paracoccaceae bacterium]